MTFAASRVSIYGDDCLVPIDDLHQSLQDNLTFIFSNLGRPGSHDLAGPRRTGRRRAEQGAPLAAVQSSYQLGFRFIWDTLVAEAHQTGIVPDAELVGIASEVWMLNTLFTTELATAYRDALTEQLLCQDQERSALVRRCSTGGSPARQRCGRPPTCWGFPTRACSSSWPRRSPRWPGTRCRGSRAACRCGESGRPGGCCPSSGGDRVAEIARVTPRRWWRSCVRALVARVGVSPVYTGLERTSQALHLARIALASSPAGDPTVNVFDDAPLPVLVVSSPTTSYRVTKTILGPLLDINPDERDMLLNTLAAFFAFQGSAIEAGKHLYCHPNTVRHRLHRIERQTGPLAAGPQIVRGTVHRPGGAAQAAGAGPGRRCA